MRAVRVVGGRGGVKGAGGPATTMRRTRCETKRHCPRPHTERMRADSQPNGSVSKGILTCTARALRPLAHVHAVLRVFRALHVPTCTTQQPGTCEASTKGPPSSQAAHGHTDTRMLTVGVAWHRQGKSVDVLEVVHILAAQYGTVGAAETWLQNQGSGSGKEERSVAGAQ